MGSKFRFSIFLPFLKNILEYRLKMEASGVRTSQNLTNLDVILHFLNFCPLRSRYRMGPFWGMPDIPDMFGGKQLLLGPSLRMNKT